MARPRLSLVFLVLAALAAAATPAPAQLLQQDPPQPIGPAGAGRLTGPMIGPMLQQLGYQTKDLDGG